MKAKSLLSLALSAVLLMALAVPATAQGTTRPSALTMDVLSARPTESIAPENMDGSRVDARIQNQVKRIFDKYVADAARDPRGARAAALSALEPLFREDTKNMSLRMFLGYLALNSSDPVKAIEVISPAEGKSKFEAVNRQNLQNLALAYYLAQRYGEAADAYDRLAAGGPLSPGLSRFAGSANLLAQRSDKAIALLEAARVGLTGEERLALLRDLAAAYVRTNKNAQAVSVYEEIIKESEPTVEILSWLGYSYLRDQKLNDAVRVLELARGKAPADVAVLTNLGNAYLARSSEGDDAKAITIYTRLTEIAPSNPVAFYNIGVLQMKAERHEAAVTAFRRATALGGQSAESRFAWNNLGFCLEKLGRFGEAAAAYAKASDLDPANGLFARNAGMSYSRVGDGANSAKYLDRARKAGVGGQAFDLTLIESMVREGRSEEALKLLKEQAEANPTNSDIWFNIGVISHRQGDKAASQAAYIKALELKPDDPDALRNYGLLLIEMDKPDEAIETLEKLVTAYPSSIEGRMALAAAFLKGNRLPEAVNIYREVVRLDANRLDARLNLADGLWNLGQTRDARFHYATVLRSQPNSARANNGMGLWHLLQSDPRSAEASFKKAIEGDASYLPAYNNLAITLERLNRKAEAILILKRALQRDPNFQDARTNLDRMENSANMQG